LIQAHGRRWLDCPDCGLISAHPDELPSPEAERARYETHNNDPEDHRYRAFLDRLVSPLAEQLQSGSAGLDYGAGPTPVLAMMMEERGFPTESWDPFFMPDGALLDRQYDFVSCSETVEHFHRPLEAYARLMDRVRPGGWLGVMTEPVPSEIPLSDWWYAKDFTHVSLHRNETFEWIGRRWGWQMERASRTVVLLRRPPEPAATF
jgi:hypothetical protein